MSLTDMIFTTSKPKPAAAASCCTVPKATAGIVQVDNTLFTSFLV